MGGGRLRNRFGDDENRARERVLPSGLRPTDEQAAGIEDRSIDPLRAWRRHRRTAGGYRPRGGPLPADRRRPGGRRARSIGIRRRARTPSVTLRSARIGRVLGMDVPQDDVVRILTALGFGVESDGSRPRRLERGRAQLPRRCDARDRSHRRSRAALRIRPFAGHVPRALDAASRARRPDRDGSQPPAGTARRRLLRVGDVRLHRAAGRPARSARRGSSRPPSPIRCPRSLPSCGHPCCRVSSTHASTTAVGSGATSGCSKRAAGSPRMAKGARPHSRGAARPQGRIGQHRLAPWTSSTRRASSKRWPVRRDLPSSLRPSSDRSSSPVEPRKLA